MLFHTYQKRIKTFVPKINKTNIENVEEFNFLGLTLDTHLNWKIHSENISNNCSRISGILNTVILNTYCLKESNCCYIIHTYCHI